jgi:hypothetical protein
MTYSDKKPRKLEACSGIEMRDTKHASTSKESLYSKYNKKEETTSEERNPLNYKDKTLSWVKSTAKAALTKSDCTSDQIIRAVKTGLDEAKT